MTEYITTFILERRRYLVAVVVFLTFAAAFPVTQVHFDNALELWFSDDDPELAIYDQFSRQFEADQIVVIGIFHDDIFDKTSLSVIDRISKAAAELEHTYRVNSITRSFYQAPNLIFLKLLLRIEQKPRTPMVCRRLPDRRRGNSEDLPTNSPQPDYPLS